MTTLAALLLAPLSARADSLVQLSAQSGDEITTRNFSSITNAIDALITTSKLQQILPNYTETSAASGTLRLPDSTLTASYVAGSPNLTVSSPGCGTRLYVGLTRSDSRRAFLHDASQFLPCVARAGLGEGPTSIQGRTAYSDWDRALADADSGLGLDARFGSFSAGGYRSNDFTLPINYAWRVSARDTLEVNVPLSFTDVRGGQSYSASVGVLWRHRVQTNWTLQASAHIGGVGSFDLATAAPVWSVGVNSVLKIDLPADWQLTVANGITYVATIPISAGGYDLDYGVSNAVFRNGALFSHALGFRLFNLPLRGSLFAVDTRYTGSPVRVDNYQEIGFFVAAGSLAPARIGATYFTGARGLTGFMVNTGVRF